ncbi:hypothetical protein FD733_08380 [Pantoea sp. Eser]|nr:hypothetical protein [Pantoea sp. Eser]
MVNNFTRPVKKGASAPFFVPDQYRLIALQTASRLGFILAVATSFRILFDRYNNHYRFDSPAHPS